MDKLKIGHISFFAPSRSGLYEASRDMCKADNIGGNEAYFFDAGVPEKDGRADIKVGVEDNRAGFKLTTSHPDMIQDMDILIMHTGIDDKYLVRSQSPIIWVVHGKPLDCYRPEMQGNRNSYTLYNDLSKWNRAKYMLYFWPEYKPYWCCFPEEKHLVFNYPVIDETRFNNSGEIYKIKDKGKYNILICDSDRADVDKFELIISAIEVSKVIPGIKFHFVGLDMPFKDCEKSLLEKLQEVNGLGDIVQRTTNMEMVYKAMDLTFSPNRIINRCIAESLCCGTPVISELGCKLADYTTYVPNFNKVITSFLDFKSKFDNKEFDKQKIIERSKVFHMKNYYTKMNEIYKEVINLG